MWLKVKASVGYFVARHLFKYTWAVKQPKLWQWMQMQFARQSQLGHPAATAFYGHLLLFKGQGLGAKEEGLRLLKIAAEAGDAKAAYQVAQNAAQGTVQNVPDLNTAVYWWKIAAKAGHYLAAKKLADIYATGQGDIAADQDACLFYQQLMQQLIDA